MFNKKRLNFLLMIFFLFAVLIGNSGCGGGSSSSRYYVPAITSDDIISPDIPITSPDLPVTSPDVPVVSPDIPKTSPDVPIVSPDIPRVSPDIPVISPDVPKISPDIPVVSPDVPDNPITSPDVPETPVGRNYVVTFNSNGGSSISRQNVQANGTVTMPENPTKENYIFAGWFKDENFTEMFLFGEDGDKITQNITLYARWIENNPDLFLVEYAIGEISIGFARGDNPNYVTHDLTLPTKINSFDSVDVTWSSNSSAISSNGKVTRPTGNDENVTLTARVAAGNESRTREFNLKVIHKNSRVSSDVNIINVTDLDNMNVSTDYFNISYNNNNQVDNIDGTFSSINVMNADDAIDAIHGIHELLGIKNTYEELKLNGSTTNEYGAKYSLGQFFNNIEVFGRRVLVSANKKGKTNFLNSNFLSSKILSSADLNTNLTKESAEQIVKSKYSGSFDIDLDLTKKIIYSLNNYEEKPIPAYIVRIYGVSNDEFFDECVFLNALTQEIIESSSNNVNATVLAHGVNELSEGVTFNVTYETNVMDSIALSSSYFMHDTELNVQAYSILSVPILDFIKLPYIPAIHSPTNTWNDRHHVSAYSNVVENIRWWREEFNRNSLDGYGGKVNVLTRAGKKDNAAWNPLFLSILTFERPENSSYDCSFAAAVDVITHETTHAVMQYEILDGPLYNRIGFLNKNAVGAINEGYADIFACLKKRSNTWTFGENLLKHNANYDYVRNITNPFDIRATTHFNIWPDVDMLYQEYETQKPDEKENDNNHVHQNSLIVSHAAYLMHTISGGLSWEDLEKLWYATLYKDAYTETSNFHDVRRNVLNTARTLIEEGDLSPNAIGIINEAFNEVGVYINHGTLSGTVVNTDNIPIIAKITISRKTKSGLDISNYLYTDSSGYFSTSLGEDNYSITISVDFGEYLPVIITQKIEANQNISLGNIVLRRRNNLIGTVIDYNTGNVIENASVNVSNDNSNFSTETDVEGYFSFNLEEGDYSLSISADDYITFNVNQVIENNKDVELDVELVKYGSALLSGTIYDSKTGSPISGVRLNIRSGWNVETGDTVAEMLTESNGTYSTPMVAGYYTVEMIKDGYKTSTFNVTVSGTVTNQNGYLEPNGSGGNTAEDVPIDDSYFPDEIFRNYVKRFDTNNDGILSTGEIEKVTSINVYNRAITDLKGVEFFTALQTLECDYNQLTTLDVSGCSALQYLNCWKNQLTTLDVSGCSALQNLYCDYNQLTTLDVSGCSALQNLYCDHNQLTTLDVSGCSALTFLECRANQLTTLDVSGCSALQNLYCDYNQLTTLDVSGCSALQNLYCDHNQLTTLDVSGCSALQSLGCVYNQLMTLDVSGCSALQDLFCQENQLTTLDVSGCSALQTLHCQYNQIRTLRLHHTPLNFYNDYIPNIIVVNSTTAMRLTASHEELSSDSETQEKIVAILPEVTATEKGIYDFEVSFDEVVRAGTKLFVRVNSEDVNNYEFYDENAQEISMPLEKDFDGLTVSMKFEADKKYSPVIIASSSSENENNNSSSGGCNSIALGGLSLIALVILLKKR